MTIIDKITNSAQDITEQDLNAWILPELVSFFEPKFRYLSNYAYGQSGDLPLRAFKQLATETIEKGCSVYLFKSQHWRTGRKLQPYLQSCLNRLAENIKKEVVFKAKNTIPVCPGCKVFNEREYLLYDGRNLRCNSCTNSIDKLQDRFKISNDIVEKSRLEFEIRLRQIFALHSRKGFRCPGCSNFIPSSYANKQRVSCPYDNICDWFGMQDELEKMPHPLGVSTGLHTSLNAKIQSDSGKELEKQDTIKSNDTNADLNLEIRERFETELKVLQEVIDTQHARLQSKPKHKVIKKILMYEAFKNMLRRHPDEMISYLVHQNYSGDLPIQSRIFQEFISLVEDSLPISIYHNGAVAEVYSLQDPRLDLFTGFSEYKANVKHDLTIPNLTQEVYIGGRKGNDRGPCFLGHLVDVREENTDQSLLKFVEYYTFSQIKMSSEVVPGLPVVVKHFRIPSHYEMNGLVQLQRSRRKVVDSVYFKLNGKKRIPDEKS